MALGTCLFCLSISECLCDVLCRVVFVLSRVRRVCQASPQWPLCTVIRSSPSRFVVGTHSCSVRACSQHKSEQGHWIGGAGGRGQLLSFVLCIKLLASWDLLSISELRYIRRRILSKMRGGYWYWSRKWNGTDGEPCNSFWKLLSLATKPEYWSFVFSPVVRRYPV